MTDTPNRQRILMSLPGGAHGRVIVGVLSVVMFLALWQLAGATSEARAALLSYPSRILTAFLQLLATGDLQRNLNVTLIELVQGFVPAVIGGVLLGAGFALSRRLRYLLEPLFVTMYIAPYVAFIPTLTVWFGVGMKTKAIIVFISALVPVTINTRAGVTEVSPQWIQALRAFGASRTQVMMKAILPGALPSIMTGIRLAIGRAIVAVIAAEMYVSIRGIGRLVQVYSMSGRTALIFVFVGLIASFGLICVSLVRTVEARLAPWRAEQ